MICFAKNANLKSFVQKKMSTIISFESVSREKLKFFKGKGALYAMEMVNFLLV